jgi:hypothetical protein
MKTRVIRQTPVSKFKRNKTVQGFPHPPRNSPSRRVISLDQVAKIAQSSSFLSIQSRKGEEQETNIDVHSCILSVLL